MNISNEGSSVKYFLSFKEPRSLSGIALLALALGITLAFLPKVLIEYMDDLIFFIWVPAMIAYLSLVPAYAGRNLARSLALGRTRSGWWRSTVRHFLVSVLIFPITAGAFLLPSVLNPQTQSLSDGGNMDPRIATVVLSIGYGLIVSAVAMVGLVLRIRHRAGGNFGVFVAAAALLGIPAAIVFSPAATKSLTPSIFGLNVLIGLLIVGITVALITRWVDTLDIRSQQSLLQADY